MSVNTEAIIRSFEVAAAATVTKHMPVSTSVATLGAVFDSTSNDPTTETVIGIAQEDGVAGQVVRVAIGGPSYALVGTGGITGAGEVMVDGAADGITTHIPGGVNPAAIVGWYITNTNRPTAATDDLVEIFVRPINGDLNA